MKLETLEKFKDFCILEGIPRTEDYPAKVLADGKIWEADYAFYEKDNRHYQNGNYSVVEE